MPDWIEEVSRFNPVNWGVHAARNAIVAGGDWGASGVYLLFLLAADRRDVVVRDVVLPLVPAFDLALPAHANGDRVHVTDAFALPSSRPFVRP